MSKVGENEFLPILQPIYKVESSYCHYLDMLKLRKNKRNDQYIFFSGRNVRKLTCLTAKFQENGKEPLQEIAWRSYGISRTIQFRSREEMSVKKMDVNALQPMLCRLRFSSKSF